MASSSADQCQALTTDGERCSRPTDGSRFCHQHDESDPTIDGADAEGSPDEPHSDGSSSDATDGTDEDAGNSAAEGATDDEERSSAILDVRETVRGLGTELIGYDLESIVGVARDDEGWQVTVEVVERGAVPDTQDIIGQYEVDLDDDQTVTGFRRVDRFRRGDMHREDYIG